MTEGNSFSVHYHNARTTACCMDDIGDNNSLSLLTKGKLSSKVSSSKQTFWNDEAVK